jgi:trk system potassium uptake protein TrkH
MLFVMLLPLCRWEDSRLTTASVGQFDSPMIEAVLIVFMTIAAINFASHFLAWHKRSLAVYWQDTEAKAVVGRAWPVRRWCARSISSVSGVYPDFLTSLRHVAFNLVSIATDCGFASQDYDKWPIFVPLWMLFLSCITVSCRVHRRRYQDDPDADSGATGTCWS